jgi:hypothetical protein
MLSDERSKAINVILVLSLIVRYKQNERGFLYLIKFQYIRWDFGEI